MDKIYINDVGRVVVEEEEEDHNIILSWLAMRGSGSGPSNLLVNNIDRANLI